MASLSSLVMVSIRNPLNGVAPRRYSSWSKISRCITSELAQHHGNLNGATHKSIQRTNRRHFYNTPNLKNALEGKLLNEEKKRERKEESTYSLITGLLVIVLIWWNPLYLETAHLERKKKIAMAKARAEAK